MVKTDKGGPENLYFSVSSSKKKCNMQIAHYVNTLVQHTTIFMTVKSVNFPLKKVIIPYFCSKHRFWV